MTDAGRPQDQGRAHRRRARPSAETATLLRRYQDAMRAHLAAILDELTGGGQTGLDGAPLIPGPVKSRELWELAIKLARELGTEVDVPPPVGDQAPTRRRSPRKVDFG